jgi:tetratricopeptide (TPR) repeat protein
MSTRGSSTNRTSRGASPGSTNEQSQLDDAMRRADELLVTSLKLDERRRNRRRIILLSLGGLAMLGIVCALVLAFGVESQKGAQLADEGWKLWQAGQFNEATEKFEEAVKLDPKNVNAYNGLGWAQFNTGKYDEAETSFKKTLELTPKFPAALNGLGQLYFAKRKYGQAEKYLLQAAPQAPAAWYGLAKLYLLQGKYDEAAKWAKKAVASGESDESAKELLQAAKDKKLSDDLRSQIEPPEINAESTKLAQAWQLMNQGRRDEAKAIFDAALAKAPQDPAALNGLGWFYLLGGDLDRAKPLLEKAIAADPQQAAGAINGLARVLKAEGDDAGAIKLWEQMLKKFPGPNAATAGLADAYLEKDDFKKAIPLLEQLLKAEPNDQEIKAKLERARKGGEK